MYFKILIVVLVSTDIHRNKWQYWIALEKNNWLSEMID